MPSRHPQSFHFSGQCFLRFASKNPPSNYLPSRAHGGTLTTNALEKKGTDGSFIAHLEMFPRLLFSSPIHSCGIAGICQLQSPEAAAGGPGPPRTPARGRPLAVAPSRAREPGSAARTPTAGVCGASGLTPASGPWLLRTRAPTHAPSTSGGAWSSSYRVTAARGPPRPWTHPGSRRPAMERKPGGGDDRTPKFPSPLWNRGGWVRQEMGGSDRGSRGDSPPTCFSPAGGDRAPPAPQPPEGRREAVTVRLALCWEPGLEMTRWAAWTDDWR